MSPGRRCWKEIEWPGNARAGVETVNGGARQQRPGGWWGHVARVRWKCS